MAATEGPARRPPRRPDPARGRRIVEGFLAAAEGGDLEGLKELFRQDVLALTDNGGRVSAARRPTLDFVYIFDIDEEELIAGVYLMADPDKLAHLARDGQAARAVGEPGA